MWIFGRRSELSSTPGVTMPSPSGIEWYQLTFAISVWSSSVSTPQPLGQAGRDDDRHRGAGRT